MRRYAFFWCVIFAFEAFAWSLEVPTKDGCVPPPASDLEEVFKPDSPYEGVMESEEIATENGSFDLFYPCGIGFADGLAREINSLRRGFFSDNGVSQEKIEKELETEGDGWDSTVFRVDDRTGYLFGALEFCLDKFEKIRCRKKSHREDGDLVYRIKSLMLNDTGRTVKAVMTGNISEPADPKFFIAEFDKNGLIYQTTVVSVFASGQMYSEDLSGSQTAPSNNSE